MNSTTAMIKVRFEGQQRLISLPDETKGIAALEGFIKKSFSIEQQAAVSLKYMDEDGDMITFDSDSELSLALKTQKQPLRVSVFLVNENDKDNQGIQHQDSTEASATENNKSKGGQERSETEESEETKKRKNLLRKARLLHGALKKQASFGNLLPRACSTLHTGFDLQLTPSELLILLQVTNIPLRRLVMCGLVPAVAVQNAVKEAETLGSALDTSTTSDGIVSDKDVAETFDLPVAAMVEDGGDGDGEEAEAFFHTDGAKTEGNKTTGEEEEGEASSGRDGGAVAAFLRSKGVPIKTRADVLALIRAFRLPPRVFLRYEGVTVKDIHGYRHFFLNNCSALAMLRLDGGLGGRPGCGRGGHGRGGGRGGRFGMMMGMHPFPPHFGHPGRGGGMDGMFGPGSPGLSFGPGGRGGRGRGGGGRGRGGRCGGGAGMCDDQEMGDEMMAMQLQEAEYEQEVGLEGAVAFDGEGEVDREPLFPPHPHHFPHEHEFGPGFGGGFGGPGLHGFYMPHPPHHPAHQPPHHEFEGGAGGPPGGPRGCPPDFQGRPQPHPFQGGPPHAHGPHPHPHPHGPPDFGGMGGGFGFGGPGGPPNFHGEPWEAEEAAREGGGERRGHAHPHEGRHRHGGDGRWGRRGGHHHHHHHEGYF